MALLSISLKICPVIPSVLDLGGNIGLFSLLAARSHPAARIYTYEPGPPNYQILEINCLANPALAKRVHLRKEAVAGQTRAAEWLFDELNPAVPVCSAKMGSNIRFKYALLPSFEVSGWRYCPGQNRH